jgi:hypothetical protein
MRSQYTEFAFTCSQIEWEVIGIQPVLAVCDQGAKWMLCNAFVQDIGAGLIEMRG